MRAEQAPLSTNVRRLREAKGLTQVGLAVAAGVSPATVARVEAGQSTKVATVEALAQVLDVPTVELFQVPASDGAA